MPNRMLRDWTQSDKIDMVTTDGERFFTRLIMKVDDYGLFWADPRLLKANLFPLKLDKIREADLLRWMAECQKAGLIVLYEVEKKKYLQIIDFKQRLDKAKAKFPFPIDNQPVNDFQEVSTDSVLELEVEKNKKLNTNAIAIGGKPPTHTQEEIDLFKNFTTFINDSAPNVSKMKEPFIIDEYLNLRKDFTKDFVKDMVLKMHNYKPLLQKNTSANLTFRNWAKRDYNGDKGQLTPIDNQQVGTGGLAVMKKLQDEKQRQQEGTN
jgi:hypothetical protein